MYGPSLLGDGRTVTRTYIVVVDGNGGHGCGEADCHTAGR